MTNEELQAAFNSKLPSVVIDPNGHEITAFALGIEWARENAKPCKGIPRPGCNYTAACGTVCNKCGKVHEAHLLLQPSEPVIRRTDERFVSDFNSEYDYFPGKCWWFAIDKETLRMVEVVEGTPGAFAFRQVAPADPAKAERAKKLADYCDAFSSGVMREIADLLRRAYL